MSTLYQTNFNKNVSINQRSKRLRHVTSISVKNLQIKANKFNVWLTFHAYKQTKAFHITDKKENDSSPKFSLNVTKFAHKEFILRVWYSNLDELDETSRLNLVLEAEINLDSLVRQNDDCLKYSIKNFNNFLIFEIFSFNFCEPTGLSGEEDDSSYTPKLVKLARDTTQQTVRNSYNLNLMIRLHDYQRVMHETLMKINQLKNTSMIKFDATSRLRELQVRKEELVQKIQLYRSQLRQANQSINELNDFNQNIKLINAKLREKLNVEKEKLKLDKEKLVDYENDYKTLVKMTQLMKYKLKVRQKTMISELASIFHIESSLELMPSTNESNMHVKNKFKLINNSFRNLNSSLANTEDDTSNSVLLGYVVHAVQMVSDLLNVPLRYPVIFRGSQSFVIEQIKEDNVCELALFRQSTSGAQDALAFSHAVDLLNRDLAQLRGLFDSYKNIDHKDMIANLKWIFDHFGT